MCNTRSLISISTKNNREEISQQVVLLLLLSCDYYALLHGCYRCQTVHRRARYDVVDDDGYFRVLLNYFVSIFALRVFLLGCLVEAKKSKQKMPNPCYLTWLQSIFEVNRVWRCIGRWSQYGMCEEYKNRLTVVLVHLLSASQAIGLLLRHTNSWIV